ncbi:hypothetical protein BLOT_002608 [Blomia tropicalis]|nr:hypothetical protein BLOT_002608 [Blomia tropicalis]
MDKAIVYMKLLDHIKVSILICNAIGVQNDEETHSTRNMIYVHPTTSSSSSSLIIITTTTNDYSSNTKEINDLQSSLDIFHNFIYLIRILQSTCDSI